MDVPAMLLYLYIYLFDINIPQSYWTYLHVVQSKIKLKYKVIILCQVKNGTKINKVLMVIIYFSKSCQCLEMFFQYVKFFIILYVNLLYLQLARCH